MLETKKIPLQKPRVLTERTQADYKEAIIVLSLTFNCKYYLNKILKQIKELK